MWFPTHVNNLFINILNNPIAIEYLCIDKNFPMTVKELARRIPDAIKAGKHHTSEIMEACDAELFYREFCLAIAALQQAGIVVYKYRQGYFIN